MEDISRLFFFLVFCAAGILSIGLAALGPEWKNLYELNSAIEQTRLSNEQIEKIISDHQVLISHINSDPNILKRIAPLSLGTEAVDGNNPAGQMTEQMLGRVRAVLQQLDDRPKEAKVPKWLSRCTTEPGRAILFTCGGGLVVVSFACFSKKRMKIKNDE
ncbi:MAG: hypothetical protein JW806_10290 [Sedimentisphaerales bacterium]|nr:hypothetical protein [Sedimentisphaerales bacterium]